MSSLELTPLEGAGMAAGVYLLLLARSAWKQGEFRKFLWSLAMLATITGIIALAVAGTIYFDRR